jgi:Helix-destabilising protein
MQIKVTILSPIVRENKGMSKANKPYHMYFQTAWAHLYDATGALNPFPEKFDVILKQDEQSKEPKIFANGEYELTPGSIVMGQYGLEVAPTLVPLSKAASPLK